MSKATECVDNTGKHLGWLIFCPACQCGHQFATGRWTFNGDTEKPTFSPSMLVKSNTQENIERGGWMPVQNRKKDSSLRVPMNMMSEQRAQQNHCGQTLARLRERGGMSPFEILCNLNGAGLWDGVPTDQDEAILTARVEKWLKDVEASRPAVCHSFVRDGRIQFLADCTHAMAGQTVDLPEV